MPKTFATPKTTKRTRKLGRAQERRLNAALATDDLLFRKFERLNEEFQRTIRAAQKRKRIVEVLGVRPGQDYRYRLQVQHVHEGPEGTLVVVVLPPRSNK